MLADLIAQATQPVAVDPFAWVDKLASLLLALAGLATAIAAVAKTWKTAGTVNTQGDRIDAVAAHARSLDSQLTTVALGTPPPSPPSDAGSPLRLSGLVGGPTDYPKP